MSTLLLDTNIVSYLFKGDTRADLYARHLRNQELAIAVMTVAELFQWAAVRGWGEARIARLEQHLEHYTSRYLPQVGVCAGYPKRCRPADLTAGRVGGCDGPALLSPSGDAQPQRRYADPRADRDQRGLMPALLVKDQI